MERRKMIRRKRPDHNKAPSDQIEKTVVGQSKELLQHPIVKGVVVVGALYGVLFISKYIIKEYAEVVAATKKLRDAHRL